MLCLVQSISDQMLHLGYVFSVDFDQFEKKSSQATVGDMGIGCHWTKKTVYPKNFWIRHWNAKFSLVKYLSFLSGIVLSCKVYKQNRILYALKQEIFAAF